MTTTRLLSRIRREFAYRPVLPNPPAPLPLSGNAATSRNTTGSTFCTNS